MSEGSMQDIAEMFRKMKFRKKLFGGVDERDVWRKLEAVQQEYRRAYEAREVKYRTILTMYGIDPARLDEAELAFREEPSGSGVEQYEKV